MSNAATVFQEKAYERQDHEKYYTPAWVTRCLLRRVTFAKTVCDPAAGAGDIMQALHDAGYKTAGLDIAPDAVGIAQGDFLDTNELPGVDIVTNPPFGHGGRLAAEFCWHALRLTHRHGGKVAMLLRDDFDSAKGRHVLFEHSAFDRKIVLLDRVRWANLPQKAAGPSNNHAWYVWDWTRRPLKPPILQYESADEDPLKAVL